jgi:geranylgeranyl pyrophosphate synthase
MKSARLLDNSRENATPPGSPQDLLDEEFSDDKLAELCGTREPSALAMLRRATYEPLSDALSRPGKSFRARLLRHAHAIASTASGQLPATPLPPELPQLIELLHAGSLIVDDVQDEAEQRRGAPALHRVIGTPLAINAGNFLYFLPQFALEKMQLDDARSLAIHRRVARSLTQCHHGQALDLSLRISELPRAELTKTVELCTRLKTGALLELACSLGAIAAGASPQHELALSRFGNEAGIALQMFDDLSGFLNPARREKAREDLCARRPTWAWALAAEQVSDEVFHGWQRLDREVALGSKDALTTLIGAIGARLEKLWLRPRARLEKALSELHAAVGDSEAFPVLAQELRGLERGYV